jgi:hypothetical protein
MIGCITKYFNKKSKVHNVENKHPECLLCDYIQEKYNLSLKPLQDNDKLSKKPIKCFCYGCHVSYIVSHITQTKYYHCVNNQICDCRRDSYSIELRESDIIKKYYQILRDVDKNNLPHHELMDILSKIVFVKTIIERS